MIWKLLVELVIGALCGFVANKIMGGNSGSILKNIILGLVGGLVGGFIGNLLGVGGGWITGVILAIGGACLVVWLWKKLVK